MATKSKRAVAALALTAGMSLVGATSTVLTTPWEGNANRAYWDNLGKVWTICNGITGPDVYKGLVLTDQQCNDRRDKLMAEKYLKPLQRCISDFDEGPRSWQMSTLDLAWNIGVGGVCNSGGAAEARQHNWAASCQKYTLYNRAGGRVVPGLDHRRKHGDAKRIGEYDLCVAGLK